MNSRNVYWIVRTAFNNTRLISNINTRSTLTKFTISVPTKSFTTLGCSVDTRILQPNIHVSQNNLVLKRFNEKGPRTTKDDDEANEDEETKHEIGEMRLPKPTNHKFFNKKITRLESDIEIDDSEFSVRLINRNPRNLEQLSFDKKPSGFWLDKSPPAYWNKLVFEQNGNYLDAYLQHWSGKKLVEASTREPKLKKYFKNPATIQAAMILGQVISRRCLQSGYLSAGCGDISDRLKTRSFFESVASGGLVLEESPEIQPRVATDI